MITKGLGTGNDIITMGVSASGFITIISKNFVRVKSFIGKKISITSGMLKNMWFKSWLK